MPVAVRELARSVLAGAAALALAFVATTTLLVHLGDTSGTRAAVLAALAIGFALGARSRLGAKAWLRSAIVGFAAIALAGALPGLTALAVGAHLPSSSAGRVLAAGLGALATG